MPNEGIVLLYARTASGKAGGGRAGPLCWVRGALQIAGLEDAAKSRFLEVPVAVDAGIRASEGPMASVKSNRFGFSITVVAGV